jgi:hypothetical protein
MKSKRSAMMSNGTKSLHRNRKERTGLTKNNDLCLPTGTSPMLMQTTPAGMPFLS